MPTFVELFSGGGLVRAGLGPGWDCLLAADWSEAKAEAYRANYGGRELRVGDIRDVAPADVPAADLVWASFPCQDHSFAGRRAGFSDGHRGRLVFHVLDLLARLAEHGKRPRVIALENVLGLVTAEGGEDFERLLTGLVSLGYRPGALAIDAVHWLPHSRGRIFIIAVPSEAPLPAGTTLRKPQGPWFPKTLVGALRRQPPAVARELVWWSLPVPPPRTLSLADMVEPFVAPAEKWRSGGNVAALIATCRPADRDRLGAARRAGNAVYGTAGLKRWDRSREHGRALVLRTDGVVNCLMGKPDLHYQQLLRVDGDQVGIRPFTARELGRLMGVPEGYRMPRTVRQAARLAGEGVAVPVVRWLATHLLEPLAYAEPVPTAPEAAPPQRCRPARRRKDLEAAPHPGAGLKRRTVATTAYFLPEEADRMHKLALALGISVHELMMRGLDRMLMEQGLPPVRRVPRARRSRGGRRSGESDITRLPSRRGREHIRGRLPPSTVLGKGSATRSLLPGQPRYPMCPAPSPRTALAEIRLVYVVLRPNQPAFMAGNGGFLSVRCWRTMW